MSSAPIVAHVAPNGFLGGPILQIFADAVKKGDFGALKIITSKETEGTKKAVATVPGGKVETIVLSYSDKASVVSALKGVDVLVSTFGGHGAQAPSEQILIEAAAEAKVKVYFNSDFGSDYDPETWGSAVYEPKKAHRAAAEKLGLKTVAIAPGSFAEAVRSPFFGINGDDWEISGDGNSPFALTTIRDIGHYAVRAVVLAHQDPVSFPSRLRIYSEVKTLNEYADINEKVTGQKINRIYVPREQLLEKWNAIGKEQPYFVLRVAADSPAHNFVGRSHNELLNPGEKYFKPTSWEEFVKSTL